MMQPLQITIKDIPHSEWIEKQIQKKIDKLDKYYNDIVSCHVVVDLYDKRHNKGNFYNIHIRVAMPEKNILVATRNKEENLWRAISEAYYEIWEQLKSYSAESQNHIKRHPIDYYGKITRLFDDFGFIQGLDEREYYFNASNVIKPDFHRLKVGTPVHFLEGEGEEGLQARHVRARRRVAA